MKEDIIESRALKIGVLFNLIMAISGWITFYFSNSEAILLDGNFSFVLAVATLSAIIISKKKHAKTSVFPFGSYVYEAFFVFFKGIMILGITIVALIQSAIKIIAYLNGTTINTINTNSILYYIVVMTALCFGLALYYKFKNKQINNKSSILSVESKSSMIDGFLTIGVGISLIVVSIIPSNSPFDFLLYIGDAIIVLILSLFLMKIPFKIIKEAFIELGGGVLQNKKAKARIERVISEHLLPGFSSNSNYITKLGSSYLIVVYVTTETEIIKVTEIEMMREKILNSLMVDYQTLNVEIIIK